jgi:hypothetical protein
MADQGVNEQDILPDGEENSAGGEGERDPNVEDISKVGIGSDINRGDEEPEGLPSEDDDAE